MTDERHVTVRDRVEVAVSVGIFEADDDLIEKWVAELPREDVAAVLLFVERLRRALYASEKQLASRIEAEAILSSAEVVTIDGKDFMWAGDRHREVTNPKALYDSLHALAREGRLPVIAMRSLREAFVEQGPKAYLQKLDALARYSEEAAQIIRDFTNWREGPPHLRPLDDEPQGGTDR